MKVAYFGYNNFSSCLPIFSQHKHEIVAIFTGDDDIHAHEIVAFSKHHKIPLYFNKPTTNLVAELVDSGVELFFCAEYPWLIPLDKSPKYTINVHPTLLPFGRGPTPISYILLHNSGHSGITFHKMTKQYDQGDVLLQQAISIDAFETYDSFSTKLFILAPLLLDQLLSKLDAYCDSSTPQTNGSYWPSINKEAQTLYWNNDINYLLKQIRAFGTLGVYAIIDSQNVLLCAATGSTFTHVYKAGSIIKNNRTEIVIAVQGGFISISKNSIFYL